MSVLRSLLFYIIFYGVSAPIVGLSVGSALLGKKPLRKIVRLWTCWHRWCVRHILGIEICIEGELPHGAVLVAIKHESFFEAIDAPCLLDFPAPFAKRELFQIPGWGFSARIYGAVPVSRGDGARALRAMVRDARRISAEKRPLVIYPEGTRVPHGEQPALRSGFAGTYKLLGLPVVPIAVDSGPLYHRRWKRAGRITYRVGEMIPAGLPREEIEARVHAAINALNPVLPSGEERQKADSE